MIFKSNRKMREDARPLLLTVAPAPGIFAGTEIATPYAWKPVEQIKLGDTVLTAEHGEQVVAGLETGALRVSSHKGAAKHWPLMIPEGALGNENSLIVSPGLRLVIEDEAAGLLFGETCVSVRAENFVGFRGIARANVPESLTHVTLMFERSVILVVEGGMFFDLPDLDGQHSFPCLDDRQSRLLIRQMGEADRRAKSRLVEAAWI